MRLMILGDVHGQTNWAVKMIRQAKRKEVDRIIQVGDFGIWTHWLDGITFLDTLNEELRKAGIKLYFVAGNHSNFDHIEWHEANGPKDYNGHTYLRTHILYTGRTNYWQWGTRSYCAAGGAVSVDKDHRTLGETYWSQEKLPVEKVVELERVGRRADYLITHDAPTCVPMSNLKPDLESAAHRQLMDRVGKVIRPTLWFHGHYHKNMKYSFMHPGGYSDVYGLNRDGQYRSSLILDTEDNSITW